MADDGELAEPSSRQPADQPCPEEARLLLRQPLDFEGFALRQKVRFYRPGQGWRSAVVLLVAEDGVLLQPAQGDVVAVGDARNLLTAEEHHAYELHRNRLKALQKRRQEQAETDALVKGSSSQLHHPLES